MTASAPHGTESAAPLPPLPQHACMHAWCTEPHTSLPAVDNPTFVHNMACFQPATYVRWTHGTAVRTALELHASLQISAPITKSEPRLPCITLNIKTCQPRGGPASPTHVCAHSVTHVCGHSVTPSSHLHQLSVPKQLPEQLPQPEAHHHPGTMQLLLQCRFSVSQLRIICRRRIMHDQLPHRRKPLRASCPVASPCARSPLLISI